MGRLVKGILVSVAALAFGLQAAAQDSIRFVDGGDLQLLEPTRPAPQPWQSLAKDKAGTAATITTPAPGAETALFNLRAKPKLDGMRIGADIKLDESDKIELREASRLSFQADIGNMPAFSSGAVQGAFGAPGTTAMTRTGFDDRALFTRSASVNLSKPLTVAMLRDPQVMVPHYAGLRIGYATGYSADDPLGLDPARRGFEVYLSSAAMSTGLDAASLAYTSVPPFARPESAYNVGVNLGYRGFTLAASYLRGAAEDAPGYESYDLGLSYDFGSWVTSIAVGGYFADHNPLSLLHATDIDQLYSVEIGAAYELRPGIHLLGRLKFFDSRTVFRETALDGLGGSFYVGTSFGF
ncbi:porin [Emcibacter sp. SYSU 3D8]|uniref:porin n=1 Tax=Emcibacter sp. SYSU 3D8 TaxID=3133969 RepID=UPI0031FF045B